jgi:VanZ family protein
MALPQPKPEFEQPPIEQPQAQPLALPPGRSFPGMVDRTPKRRTLLDLLRELLPFDTRKAEFKFFLVIAGLIAYGSLYPFHIHFGPSDWTLRSLAFHRPPISLGDIASNVVLFLPFGFLGVRAMRSPFRPWHYVLLITLLALIVSYLIQYLQYYVPSRIPSRLDVICNVAGAFLAGTFGSVSRFRFFGGKRKLGVELWHSAPLLLAGCWVAYLLVPFIPSVDLGQIKNSLKPLLLHPELSPMEIFRNFTGWLVFAHLCSAHMKRPLRSRLLVLVMAATLLGQVLIMRNAVTWSHVLGSLTALLVWHALFKSSDRRERTLAPLLMIMLLLHALLPFDPDWIVDRNFHWLPLSGFLEGYRFINISVLFSKMFFYGGLVWLMQEASIKWGRATVLPLILLCSIELLQYMFNLKGHVPETTDPLILVLMAYWIKWYRPKPLRIDYIGPERRGAETVR